MYDETVIEESIVHTIKLYKEVGLLVRLPQCPSHQQTPSGHQGAYFL